jgi:outer membrane protein TolC
MPAEMMGGEPGTFVPITFGSKYSLSAGVQLNQKIYDPYSILNIKSVKLSNQISEVQLEQTKEETYYNICIQYFQTLVILIQKKNLENTLISSESLLKAMELKYLNGLAKKIDVDKIKVSYNNSNSQLQQIEQSYLQSVNMLKYSIGMPIDSIINIDTTINIIDYSLELENIGDYDLSSLTSYKIQKMNLMSSQINEMKIKSTYLPTLSFYGSYNINAMRQEFNFLQSGNEWFQSYGIGLKLSVPIFNGFQKNSQLSQSKIFTQIANENLWITEQTLKVNLSNYEIQYNNVFENLNNEKENLDLANSIYVSTQNEYKEGVCSTVDLIQAENSYSTAQNNYYNKLLEYYLALIEIEKNKGTINEFINNLK